MVKNWVLSEVDDNWINGTLQIYSTKLYVPVVNLSINDNIKFLEKLKQ